MKAISKLALVILALTSATANSQTTLYDKDGTKLVLDGHMEMMFGTDNPVINPDSIHFGSVGTMIRPIFRLNSDPLFAVLEPNISNIGVNNSNWLLQAAVGYKFTPDFSILAGRIMTSNIMLTPPARFNPLVRCPRFPMGVYGYGIQISDKLSEQLSLLWDFTTNTASSFQDQDRFDGLETSLRLAYNFNKEWSLAGNASYDFRYNDSFFGLDAEYKKGPLDIRLVGYDKERKNGSDILGAYLIGSYLLTSWLEADCGLDVQQQRGISETIGLRIFFTEDKKTDLRLDYIHSSESFGPYENSLVLGLRKRF